MAEPTGITTNVAPIFSADLLYEQNCKCGTIEVLGTGEEWAAGAGDKVWRIDVIYNGDSSGRPIRVFTSLGATNISGINLVQLAGTRFINGQTIMGDFTSVIVGAYAVGATVILYKDCRQS